jgi:hypothetical protein
LLLLRLEERLLPLLPLLLLLPLRLLEPLLALARPPDELLLRLLRPLEAEPRPPLLLLREEEDLPDEEELREGMVGSFGGGGKMGRLGGHQSNLGPLRCGFVGSVSACT